MADKSIWLAFPVTVKGGLQLCCHALEQHASTMTLDVEVRLDLFGLHRQPPTSAPPVPENSTNSETSCPEAAPVEILALGELVLQRFRLPKMKRATDEIFHSGGKKAMPDLVGFSNCPVQ